MARHDLKVYPTFTFMLRDTLDGSTDDLSDSLTRWYSLLLLNHRHCVGFESVRLYLDDVRVALSGLSIRFR